ncbi:helix-turn-helix transcriptional regulator [Oceanirhabdus seepicola]|uniref:YafY family transcriptional regulator n=1 Tax=Oceanirhabdus seepicola TaxID=2828781 RepID=A0A9J6P045_9CLOT|nr:YafY family protein [Oceanirhabdus seepicola]MCM1989574.1 YafY family transcriptional regulator [Oceanirhabdus seepicola]
MKIDRLLAIITYLLNRDVVTGKYLAEKFDVSERTIQRDVETINLAGIPITSIRGSNGGYKILDTYRLSKQTSTEKDLESITLALRSLNSAMEDERVSDTLEKVKSIGSSKTSSSITVDFGVAKENKKVVEYIKIMENAISNKIRIEFSYINAENYATLRTVEPISLKFKWYSWYLVAYCTEKNQYRIFKLMRMENLKQTNLQFANNHDNNPNLFDDLMNRDNRKYIDIVFRCNKSISTAISEYMPGVKFTEMTGENYKAELTVTENERMWFAFMLSFGDDIEVIEPEHLQRRLVEHAKKIINKYEIPDK